jgi:chromosome segregation ATPase
MSVFEHYRQVLSAYRDLQERAEKAEHELAEMKANRNKLFAMVEEKERELARVRAVVEAAREADWWFNHSAQNAVDGPYDFDEEAAALRHAIRALDAKEGR